MFTFTADPRDGVPVGGVCSSCCCDTMSLRPGETNRVTINYAPWSLPLERGLVVGTFKKQVVTNSDACDPVFTVPNQSLVTALNTPLVIDPDAGVDVAGTYVTSLFELSAPENGALEITGQDITYTPNTGFEGYDYFTYTLTNPAGDTQVVAVEVNVGVHNQMPDMAYMSTQPFVDNVVVDTRMHTVSFPLHMPRNCSPCETHRLTVSVKARDCDNNLYEHFKCFDITCKDC